MSIWDHRTDFLAEEAALLVTADEFEAKGLLRLMQEAYNKALDDTRSKFMWTIGNAKVFLGGKLITGPYKSAEDPLPEDGLYSVALQGHVREIFDLKTDADWREAMTELYQSWCKDETSKSSNGSHRFEIQHFARAELHRWFAVQKIESDYAFMRNEPPTANESSNSEPLDLGVLATPERLLAAFEQWGLKARWFNEPKNHAWLKNARKQIGVGGNRPKPPLYCPYEVMIGLATKTKPRDRPKPISLAAGWRRLKAHFPATYEKFRHLAPDDDQC